MSTGTAGSGSLPGQSSAPATARTADRERYIERQLRTTRRQLRSVELASRLMLLAAAAVLFFLVAAVVDHWLVPGGLTIYGRLAFLAVFLAAAAWFVARELAPLFIYRINPLFAAQTIERAKPTLKNSLLNFLLLRSHRTGVSEVVLNAVEEQAAATLKRTPIEHVVDRSRLIQFAYVLLAAVAAFCLYYVVSPKSPLQTLGRVVLPWADLSAPSRVQLDDIQPGTTTVFRGERVSVTAAISGLGEDEAVTLYYSTADQQRVDQPLRMYVTGDSHRRHTVSLPPRTESQAVSDAGNGVQQDIEYRIEAGDARSRTYRLSVIQAPNIVVDRLQYAYPEYTRIPSETVERTGDIKAVEGTQVTIHATANQPIASAYVDLGGDGRHKEPMKVRGQQATATLQLALNDERTGPAFSNYQLRFVTDQGHENREPIRYRIEVTPDPAPELQLLRPEKVETAVSLNAAVPFEVEARDTLYGLSDVTILAKVGGELAFRRNRTVARDDPSAVHVVFKHNEPLDRVTLGPGKRLKVGDVIEYWAEAIDNKSPKPNVTKTDVRKLVIVDPKQNQNQQDQNQQPQDNQQGGNENQQGNQRQDPNNPPQNQRAGNNQQQNNQKNDQNDDQRNDNAGDNQNQQQGDSRDQQGSNDRKGNDGQKNNSGQQGGAGDRSRQDKGSDDGKGGANDQKRQADNRDAQVQQRDQQRDQNRDQNNDARGAEGNEDNRNGQKNGAGKSADQKNAGSADQQKSDDEHSAGKSGDSANEQSRGQKSNDNTERSSQANQGAKGNTEGSGRDTADERRPDEHQPVDQSDEGEAFNRILNHAKEKEGVTPEQSAGQQGDKEQAAGKQGADERSSETQNPDQQRQDQQGADKQGADKQSADQSKTAADKGKTQNDQAKEQADKDGKSGTDQGKEQGTQKNESNDRSQATKQNQNATDRSKAQPGAEKKAADRTKSGEAKNEQKKEPTDAKNQRGASTPSPQEDARPKKNERPNGAGAGKQEQKQEEKSPAHSKHDSNTQGEQGGDRRGDGKDGGGQSKNQAGKGAKGSSDSANEGAQGANEQGNGDTGDKAGDDKNATGKTGRAGDENGNGSQSRPATDNRDTTGKANDRNQDGKNSDDRNAAKNDSTNSDQQARDADKGKSKSASDSKNGQQDKSKAGQDSASNPQGDAQNDGQPTNQKSQDGKNASGSKQTQPGGNGTPTGGGGTESSANDEPPPERPRVEPTDDKANLEYAKRATDLALEHLRNQLKDGKPDEQLLDRLGWSKDDLQKLLSRWEKMEREAKQPGPQGTKGKENLEEAIRSLGFGSTTRKASTKADDRTRGLRDAARSAPPPEYAEEFRAFQRSTSRAEK